MPPNRTLGLTCPVSEALDPKLWRERYAYGVLLGVGAPPAESRVIDRLLGCRGRTRETITMDPATAAAAQGVVTQAANEIPDHVIRWHLRTAMSELSVKLGIPFGMVICKGDPVDEGLVLGRDYDKVVPRQTYLISEQQRYYRIDLPAGTVSVERVRAFWFDQLIWEVDGTTSPSAIKLDHPGTSSMHILPTQGVGLIIAFPASGVPEYGSLQLLTLPNQSRLPAVWSVDYTLDTVAKTGEPGRSSLVLAHWIACRAGILLLSIAGSAVSRGLTSTSVSIDGLSRSIGLQASAMYGIYSALETRMKEAEEAIDWKHLRLYKRGLRPMPYGS